MNKLLDAIKKAAQQELTSAEADAMAAQLIGEAKSGDVYAIAALAVVLAGNPVSIQPTQQPVAPVEARSFGNRGEKSDAKPAVGTDGSFACPKCGGQVWDNRKRIENGEFNPKSPTFTCKDKTGCGWVTWNKTVESQPKPVSLPAEPPMPDTEPEDDDLIPF